MTLGAPISDKLARFFSFKETGLVYSRPPYAHQVKAWNETERLFEKYHAAFHQMGIGTGKTFTAINLARKMFQNEKIEIALIVAPKTLLGTWEMQIKEHCLDPYSIIKWDAIKAKTKKWGYDFSSFMQDENLKFILINVEAFSVINSFLKLILKTIYKKTTLMVLDESSTIKTHNSARTKTIIKEGKKAMYRLAMTGTTITKSPLDVYGQVEYLCPRFFGESFFMFKQRYAVMIDEYGAGRITHKKVIGYQKIDELIEKVDQISFKARTEDCIDLPKKTFETIYVELGKKTKGAYDELEKTLVLQLESDTLSTPSRIAQFTKLRQIVGGFVLDENGETHALGETDKLDTLVDMVEDTDDQVVIFANHRAEIMAIAERLGDDAVTFYGDTEDRDTNLRAFQTGERRFFVAHPQSGGMGLNLQSTHIMFFYGPITRDYQQLIGRIHRSGQDRPCIYYTLVARGTVDENLVKIVENDETMLRLFESGDAETFMKIIKK